MHFSLQVTFSSAAVSAAIPKGQKQKGGVPKGTNPLLVGESSASWPYSSDRVTLAPVRTATPSSAKHKHWVTDLAHLDSTEHLNERQVF